MRYAIFTDVHANLEALQAVLAKIDELAQSEPIDEIWFLGDLVGYGPNPNECIAILRERTSVIIAGNHDWAAVGKIDLEDFSSAARVSAEWTAEQLSEENRIFLKNLPERIEKDQCTLVHGSPYGPLWEYLTSEALAERSFQYFTTRYCFVGHTHVPIIFQQPDISNEPTHPLSNDAHNNNTANSSLLFEVEQDDIYFEDDAAADEETSEMAALRPTSTSTHLSIEIEATHRSTGSYNEYDGKQQETTEVEDADEEEIIAEVASEEGIANEEEHINQEIEELLTLLGLSQSMIQVTNEMLEPPIGTWQTPDNYRAIVNPGGVGQPRDGDARAAFMIYDTEKGFTFYRIPYTFEKTQEKIIKAGLPTYLATRLAYGR